MKTIPEQLRAHMDGGATTLAKIWRVTRSDGRVFAFTNHDEPIRFEGRTYACSSAFDASAIQSRADLAIQSGELVGLLDSDGITAEDIEAGLWDGATVLVSEVNWSDPSQGANVLLAGELGNIQRRGANSYGAEMRGLAAKLANNVGRVITPLCDATLGDSRCGVDLAAFTVPGTVTAVTSRRQFAAAGLVGSPAMANYFSFGKLTWTTGANADRAMEVKDDDGEGNIELQLQMPHPIEAGDTFNISPGCNKIHRVNPDKTVEGDCKNKFGNVLNFRGFPDVPGADQVLKVGGQ